MRNLAYAFMLVPAVALGILSGWIIFAVVSLQIAEVGYGLAIAIPAHVLFMLMARDARDWGTSSEWPDAKTTVFGLSATSWKILIMVAYAMGMLLGALAYGEDIR